MMTREKLESYIYLEKYIDSLQKKINRAEENIPAVSHGKVKGSRHSFPYTESMFLVSGPDGFGEYEKWEERIKALYNEFVNKKVDAEKTKIEIEEFINVIPDVSTKLIFTYIFIDGMNQIDVAEKLYMDQTTISKRISRYLGKNDKAS